MNKLFSYLSSKNVKHSLYNISKSVYSSATKRTKVFSVLINNIGNNNEYNENEE